MRLLRRPAKLPKRLYISIDENGSIEGSQMKATPAIIEDLTDIGEGYAIQVDHGFVELVYIYVKQEVASKRTYCLPLGIPEKVENRVRNLLILEVQQRRGIVLNGLYPISGQTLDAVLELIQEAHERRARTKDLQASSMNCWGTRRDIAR